MKNELQVLLYMDGDTWIARCLQCDIMSQGKNAAEAIERFLGALNDEITLSQIDGIEQLTNIKLNGEKISDELVGTHQIHMASVANYDVVFFSKILLAFRKPSK